jgi:hypothetical protein
MHACTHACKGISQLLNELLSISSDLLLLLLLQVMHPAGCRLCQAMLQTLTACQKH